MVARRIPFLARIPLHQGEMGNPPEAETIAVKQVQESRQLQAQIAEYVGHDSGLVCRKQQQIAGLGVKGLPQKDLRLFREVFDDR